MLPNNNKTQQNFFNPLGVDFQKRGQDILNAVNYGSDAIKQGLSGNLNPLQVGTKLAETGLRTAGAVTGNVNDMFGRVVKGVTSPVIDYLGNNKTVQNFAMSPSVSKGLDTVNTGINNIKGSYNDFSNKYPNFTKDAESAANIGSVLYANKYSPNIDFKKTASPMDAIAKNISNVSDDLKQQFGQMNLQDIKSHLSNSQFGDIQSMINSGQVPREAVYQGSTNLLKPEFAAGRVQDMALKLNAYRPGLGDQFIKGLDLNNITMTGNVPETLVQRANQLIDNVSSSIPGKSGINDFLNSYFSRNKQPVAAPAAVPEASNSIDKFIYSYFRNPDKIDKLKRIVNDIPRDKYDT